MQIKHQNVLHNACFFYLTLFLNRNPKQKINFAVGQVLYDQLLTNPPGSEGSKGSWLSGAL